MTADTSPPVARVRDLPDLLGVIPHLLGFHPEESMILIVVEAGQIQLTARTDLADLREPGHLELLIDRMLLRWPAGAMWVVAYTVRESIGWQLLRRARRHLGDSLFGEPICVSGVGYRVGDADGEVFRHDPRTTRTAVAATVHGLQARPSRAALVGLVRSDPRHSAAAEEIWVGALERVLTIEPADRPEELMQLLGSGLLDPAAVSRDHLARLGLLINDPLARDRAVLSLEQTDAEAWVELWSRVVRACPHGTQDNPLAVLGLAAWVSGNGALQSVCLEEMDALGITPGLKNLLEHLNAGVVPPSEWPGLRETLRELLEETSDEDEVA